MKHDNRMDVVRYSAQDEVCDGGWSGVGHLDGVTPIDPQVPLLSRVYDALKAFHTFAIHPPCCSNNFGIGSCFCAILRAITQIKREWLYSLGDLRKKRVLSNGTSFNPDEIFSGYCGQVSSEHKLP